MDATRVGDKKEPLSFIYGGFIWWIVTVRTNLKNTDKN